MKDALFSSTKVEDKRYVWLENCNSSRSTHAHGADLVVDGEYGKKTEAAVSIYQKSVSKDTTGMANPRLLSILSNAE